MPQVPQQLFAPLVANGIYSTLVYVVAAASTTAWGSGVALGAVQILFHNPTPIVELYKGP